MKKFYATAILIFTLSLSALATTSYVVSGTGSDDGIYVQSGTCNGDSSYSMTNGSNTYTLLYNGSQWTIGMSFGSCINSEDYSYSSTAATPPLGIWNGFMGATTVSIYQRTISYSTNYLVENISLDGSISGNVIIRYNKFNGDTFTGTTGENYVTDGKIILSNMPAGLTGVVLLNNDSTLTFTFTGKATIQNNSKVFVQFLNSAVSGGDTSLVAGHTDSLQIYFRKILTVAHSGASYDSISKAITASTPYDIIQLARDTFTESNLTVNFPLIFRGNGADKTIVQADRTPYNGSNPVFNITTFTDWVEFYNLTIQNGNVSSTYAFGGGITGYNVGFGNPGPNIKLAGCRIINNQVNGSTQSLGGGVFTDGNMKIYDCEFSGNKVLGPSAEGGGLRVGGQFTIINSTFSNNYASVNGGGVSVENAGGNIGTILNTTFANNDGPNAGGGICTSSAITMTNVILYGNNSGGDYYGVGNATNCIIGVVYGGGLLTNVNGSIANPMLSGLANNGGTTQTCALQAGSPAINAGAMGAAIPTTDQRGYGVNGIPDIGAYDYMGLDSIINPEAICANSYYAINGHTYTTPGSYNDTLQNIFASDSLVVTQLTVDPLPPVPTISSSGNVLTSSSVAGNQWLLNGVILTGRTSDTLHVSIAGNYSVIVSNSNKCSDTSAIFNLVPTGIKNLAFSNSVSVFPNPNSGQFILKYELTSASEAELAFYDIIGNKVKSILSSNQQAGSYQMNLDVSDLNNGIYFLKGTINAAHFTERIVLVK